MVVTVLVIYLLSLFSFFSAFVMSKYSLEIISLVFRMGIGDRILLVVGPED